VTLGTANTIVSSNAVHLTVVNPPKIDFIWPNAIYLERMNNSKTIKFNLTGSFSNMRDLDYSGRFLINLVDTTDGKKTPLAGHSYINASNQV
jgi:hypothetical protein